MQKTKLLDFFGKRSLWAGAIYLASGLDSKTFGDVGKIFGASGPAGSKDLGSLIVSIVNILLLVAGSIAVIFLIVGGYRYVVAHGNEEATEAAKKTITSAIIGLVIIILSFVIISVIISALTASNGLGI